MHKHTGPVDTSKGYEQSDLSIKAIGVGVTGFFIFTAVMGVVGAVLTHMWGGYIPNKGADFPRPMPSGANPMLQNGTTAKTDIYNLKYMEHKNMTSFRPMKDGKFAVPVDKAMEMMAEHDLKLDLAHGGKE